MATATMIAARKAGRSQKERGATAALMRETGPGAARPRLGASPAAVYAAVSRQLHRAGGGAEDGDIAAGGGNHRGGPRGGEPHAPRRVADDLGVVRRQRIRLQTAGSMKFAAHSFRLSRQLHAPRAEQGKR